MKKIYLIRCQSTTKDEPVSFIAEIFANKRKAEEWVKYWNNVKNHHWTYWIETHAICTEDLTKLNK